MIVIDITMIIQIINILILIVIMNAVLYKPVRTILAEREKKIDALGRDIENFHENAKLRQEEIDRKLGEAREKAKTKLDEVRTAAQTAGTEKLTKVRDEVDAAKTEQLAQISTQISGAQKQLTSQVKVFATEIADKILGRSL